MKTTRSPMLNHRLRNLCSASLGFKHGLQGMPLVLLGFGLPILAIIDLQMAQSLTDMAAIKLLSLKWVLLVGSALNAPGQILDFMNLNAAL